MAEDKPNSPVNAGIFADVHEPLTAQ